MVMFLNMCKCYSRRSAFICASGRPDACARARAGLAHGTFLNLTSDCSPFVNSKPGGLLRRAADGLVARGDAARVSNAQLIQVNIPKLCDDNRVLKLSR
jgi:hypothetical protein